MERGLTEAIRLNPRLHSAYIDLEMLTKLRHPDDPHADVAAHARLVAGGVATNKGYYWVSILQRPMHFYPKLRSMPWWDAGEFEWCMKLMMRWEGAQPVPSLALILTLIPTLTLILTLILTLPLPLTPTLTQPQHQP